MTTDITELAQREKFEAWWEREYKHLESSKYTDAVQHIKYGFWMAYQAGGAELVEALEKAQKSNEFLKGQLSELANFNPNWDKLEASYDSWREIAAELLVAKERIAELESKLFNPVQLPKTNGYWTETEKTYEEAITLAKRQIRLAGFRCEGDE